MRKNKRHTANEMYDLIQLRLKKGVTYIELVETYGLRLSKKNFNKYVSCRAVLESKSMIKPIFSLLAD